MKTGYVAWWGQPGGLPVLLAFEVDEPSALAAARASALDNLDGDEDDLIAAIEVAHVDLVESRNDYDPEDWVLFGWPYVPDGYDAAVRHGATKIEG